MLQEAVIPSRLAATILLRLGSKLGSIQVRPEGLYRHGPVCKPLGPGFFLSAETASSVCSLTVARKEGCQALVHAA